MAAPSAEIALPAPGGAGLRKALRALSLLRESPVGMIGVALVAFWVLVAIFAPLIAPYDPLATQDPFRCPPWWQHDYCQTSSVDNFYLLGTDHLGRDIFSRLVWGARRVLIYAPLATVCAYTVGIVMGLCAGYYRGWTDNILSRFADLILSFPVLVLYILIIAHFGASALNIVVAIIFASGPGVMRIVRGLVLDLRTREYVAAAETRGEPAWWIMLVEILPNARGPLIVDACLRLGYGHHHHRRARLPRARAAPAGPGLGRHDQRDPVDGDHLSSHDRVPLHRNLDAHPRIQPDGRRTARNLYA